MGEFLTYLFWVALLAALLVYPVAQWIWALSVRRLQRKLDREASADEVAVHKRRAWKISAVVCPLFSLFFNASTMGVPL